MQLATTSVVATPTGEYGKISEQIMATLLSKAWTICLSSNILGIIKSMVNRSTKLDLESTLEYEADHQCILCVHFWYVLLDRAQYLQ